MKFKWYGVFYVGAPYGENEMGELISKHKSMQAAEAARQKLQWMTKYYGLNTKIMEF
jgi:hypothetical protein